VTPVAIVIYLVILLGALITMAVLPEIYPQSRIIWFLFGQRRFAIIWLLVIIIMFVVGDRQLRRRRQERK